MIALSGRGNNDHGDGREQTVCSLGACLSPNLPETQQAQALLTLSDLEEAVIADVYRSEHIAMT